MSLAEAGTLEEVITLPNPTEPGDHDTFSHYVMKDQIARSAVEGTPAIALCGKVWVPTKNGRKYPVCPDCAIIMEEVVGSNLPPEERGEAELPE